MRRLSRDSWLAIGLLITLVLVTIAAAISQAQDKSARNLPELSSSSSAPNGAKALQLCLDELGYAVSAQVSQEFRPPENTSLILMLEPSFTITPSEWELIDTWVGKGGTLVLAGNRWGAALAFKHFDFDLASLSEEIDTLIPQPPLQVRPALTGPVSVHTQSYLETDRGDFIAHLADGSRPVLVSFTAGEGEVILSTAPFSFSNAGLKEAGNPELVLNLVGAAQKGGVWFDEWHHGLRPEQAQVTGPGDWLRRTPAGHSVLYVAGVIFVALLRQGRRFGRPVPLTKTITRRSPLEYITAIANLSRRAGHRQATLQAYRQKLKRDLGKRYQLNPTLPDDEYVAQLGRYDPTLDQDALRELLIRLDSSKTNESEMVQLAAQVADQLQSAARGPKLNSIPRVGKSRNQV